VQQEPNAPVTNPAFNAFTEHYITLMKNLNSTQTKAVMAAQLNPNYNQTDIFTWKQSKMTFAQDSTGWFEDPTQILNSGDAFACSGALFMCLLVSAWLSEQACSSY